MWDMGATKSSSKLRDRSVTQELKRRVPKYLKTTNAEQDDQENQEPIWHEVVKKDQKHRCQHQKEHCWYYIDVHYILLLNIWLC